MPNRPFSLYLDPRGDVDTAMPITDRKPGTLVEALDVDCKYWGPRPGSKAFTRIWENPGTASLYDEITFTASPATHGRGVSYEEQFRDLGTKFTLDLWARATSVTAAAGQTAIGLYENTIGTYGFLDVRIAGPAHATPNRVIVRVTTTPTRSSAASTVTLTSSSGITVGSAQTDKAHIRVVRDGVNLTVYINGVSAGTVATLSATDNILGAINSAAVVKIGGVYFQGQVFGAVLRDGAFTSYPIENVMPCSPWARNVHHYYLGRLYSLGGSSHVYDAGRYGAHARLTDTGFSTSAANDNTMPAPCPVQGMKTWTTRSNRSATSVAAGGVLSTSIIS